jgi:hypothetical protein
LGGGERWACAHDSKLSKAPSDLSILLRSLEAPEAGLIPQKEVVCFSGVEKHLTWDHFLSPQDEPSKRQVSNTHNFFIVVLIRMQGGGWQGRWEGFSGCQDLFAANPLYGQI